MFGTRVSGYITTPTTDVSGIEEGIKNSTKVDRKRNKSLDELVKLQKIELSNKKPEVMFLFELLEFLKSIPQWDPRYMTDDDLCFYEVHPKSSGPKACFVGEKWNGRVEAYRDFENLVDFTAVEGEAVFFDVQYYIDKLTESLNALYNEVDDE